MCEIVTTRDSWLVVHGAHLASMQQVGECAVECLERGVASRVDRTSDKHCDVYVSMA